MRVQIFSYYLRIVLVFSSFCYLWGTAQTIYVPSTDPIYNFLEHSHLRSLSTYSEVAIPITRQTIAQHLIEISDHKKELSRVEQNELGYFEEEYQQEIHQLKEVKDTSDNSCELYHYRDSLFRLELSPRIGGLLADGVKRRWYGIQLYGYIEPQVGYSFYFADNEETGSNITIDTHLTPIKKKNIVLSQNANTLIDYSYCQCNLTSDFGWFRLGVGQDNIEWGSGYRGKLILSSKPEPFPYLRMEFRPTDWLHLYYIHGWLKSNVLDTLESYNTEVSGMTRNVYRDKYIAAHILDIKPSKNWEIAFGESIIYSDMGPQLIFLIPINFFRAADHYLTTNENIGDGNNSQFFADVQYWGITNVKLYNTLFIDEINLNTIFEPNKSRNQIGNTMGIRLTGLPTNEFDWTLEYTIILPWVYSNFTQTQLYENNGEYLGYYLGDNCDEVYTEVTWHPFSTIQVTGYIDYVRKGGMADIAKEYELPSLPFLYGNVSHRSLQGVSINYHPYHNILLRSDFTFGDIRYSGENSNWIFSLKYGM